MVAKLSFIFSGILFWLVHSFSNDNRYMSANPITRFLFKGKQYGKDKLDAIKQSFQRSLKKISINNRSHMPSSSINREVTFASSSSEQNDLNVSNASDSVEFRQITELALPPSDKINMDFNQSNLFPDIEEEVEFGLPGVSMNGIFRRRDMEKALHEIEDSLQDLKDWLDEAEYNFTEEESHLLSATQNHNNHQSAVSKRHYKFLGDAIQKYDQFEKNNIDDNSDKE